MAKSNFVRLSKPRKSAVYDTYWYFAAKRFEVFEKRLTNHIGPWTDDHIISSNRFTNVFRASDRVSQFLIDIQYQGESLEEIFFKTLLFKLFNKIETYKYLERSLSEISYKTFSIEEYDSLLTMRLAEKQTIYSAAYIMPSAGNVFGHKFKHSNHLALLSKMIKDGLPMKIAECKKLEDVYSLILSYPSLGKFLAFQYTIDINYSELTDFSEMDFVVAGPGAKNGIEKCFDSLGDYSYEDIIKLMADNQDADCERLGIKTPTLWGRSLQLIDCQNLFCEVDKYLRGSNPELSGSSGRTRIKQKYKVSKGPINYFFPPKWNLNNKVKETWQIAANVDIFS
jgi:hypothetical protein